VQFECSLIDPFRVNRKFNRFANGFEDIDSETRESDLQGSILAKTAGKRRTTGLEQANLLGSSWSATRKELAGRTVDTREGWLEEWRVK
jgi:hypothetical protein